MTRFRWLLLLAMLSTSLAAAQENWTQVVPFEAYKPDYFLLGQPEFRRTLQSPELEQLRQRVIASCHLGPLDGRETEAYIMHRLKAVGWRDDPSFSSDAYAAIYQYTGGIPRKINILCNRLMLMGRVDEKHAFTGKEVAEVVHELQQEFAPADLRVNR